MANMSFKAIHKNKVLAKISEFTVPSKNDFVYDELSRFLVQKLLTVNHKKE